jgi:hypothetical protein
METLITTNRLIILIILIILSVLLSLTWKYTKQCRAKNELKFDIMYLNIQTMLRDEKRPVNERNRVQLMSYFNELRKLRYKNVEKVQTLWDEYCKKYNGLVDIMLSK